MALSDSAIRTAKPRVKAFKLFDTGGLYLGVFPSGGKRWRLKYRFEGKERALALGVYPDVSLAMARARRDEARRQVADGIDPGAVRKARKQASRAASENSFELVAREWFGKLSVNWAPNHSSKVMARFENDLFPYIGKRPIHEITAPELLAALRKIEKRGAVDTAHRARQTAGQVFRYAIATGRASRDTASDLRGALASVRGGHFAAVTDPKALGALLRTIGGYSGTLPVQCALRLAPLVFVRPGELRAAEWKDFDLEAAEWRFVTSKTGMAHIVPLASQAVAILREVQPLTGRGRYVFPSGRGFSRAMSENALLAAMRRMGIEKSEMTGHGWRATARTILDEVLGFAPHLIEHQLAHGVKDPMGRSYNRTSHLPERRAMMQAWANYLDELRTGGEVIKLRG